MWADSLLLMYIIHGILIATNLIIAIIIVKFVRQISALEFKINLILKICEQSSIANNKKNNESG